MEIPLNEGAKPYHSRALTIPNIYKQTFNKDLYRLESIGVLRKVNRSKWAKPSFIIAKKDGQVRFISDFQKLNSQIKWAPYPFPHIKNMLLKVSNFIYATALDLVMGYYNIKMLDDSNKIFTITTPFGKYECLQLPMGIIIETDIFQDHVFQLF